MVLMSDVVSSGRPGISDTGTNNREDPAADNIKVMSELHSSTQVSVKLTVCVVFNLDVICDG